MLNDHLSASPGGPDDLVFTSREGGPIRQSLSSGGTSVQPSRRALPADKHGLRFHDLRHTCASLLITQGAHPKAIHEQLGHSSITITMDRYGHLLPSARGTLADRLDAAYAETAAPPENVHELRGN